LYYFKQDLLIKLIGTSFFYRVDRLLTFVNNDSFQLDRALIAIGSSTLLGSKDFLYIPEAPTDFIIALSISNFGLISFIMIIICFLILDVYFLYKTFKLNNLKSKMFYAGFLTMFIFAQIQNIGMNLGLLPIIGLPLPFVSYGGTNIIVYFIFLGMLNSLKN
ncbi:MAG: FtsW/RodA/SpoVE family cell cycle protein, partial [Bacilli bacterium]|nr:FtsW/RodA/SpoVE family cell cycle protein [Bacilli bacterium]